jgi:tetratricopeptide (TPR) repeat protein
MANDKETQDPLDPSALGPDTALGTSEGAGEVEFLEEIEIVADSEGLGEVVTAPIAEAPGEQFETQEVQAIQTVEVRAPAGLLPENHEFFAREASALAERQPERAALMWMEAASAAELGGGDPPRILTDVESAIALRQSSAWLLPLARRMLMRQRQYDRALDLGAKEVSLGGENAVRAAVLQEAAALHRFNKRSGKASLALLEKALTIQPGDVPVLAATVSVRSELGLHPETAEALELLSVSLTVADERALCLYAAGTLREMVLAQLDSAESDYRRAVEGDRQNLPAVMALCALYERRGHWRELAGCLEHMAQLAPSPAVEARLLHQAGSLHLDRTGDLEAAARDLARAAKATSSKPSTLQRLAYVYEAKGQIRDLVATLLELLDHTIDATSRAALLTHIAWLHQVRLGENEEAVRCYRQALEAVSGYLPALQSLSTLYRLQGSFEQLIEIYQPEIEGTLPPRTRAMRCVEMGEILVSKLGRPEEAAASFRRALELDPSLFTAFWGLARLLRQLGRNEELAELLAAQAKRSKDDKSRTGLLLELAHLQAGPLGSLEMAIETLESMRDEDRTRVVAFDLLDLYEKALRHAELASFLLVQAKDTKDAEEAQGRHLQAAAVLEERLEEYDQALEIYKTVLKEDPKCVAAIRGAGRIYHRLGWWNELVKLHHHELTTEPDRPDASIFLCRIARILEENLGQTSAAIKAYSKALEKEPSCAPALPALERLVRVEKRWADLVQVIQKFAAARKDRTSAADALCRAAEIADCQLGNLDQALELYQKALALDAGSSLTRVGLLRAFRRKESWRDVAGTLAALVERSGSDDERGLFELELARTREFLLGEPPDLALYEAAGAHPRLGPKLLLELTRIQRRLGTPDLPAWLERVGEGTADPALASALLLESASSREFAAVPEGDGLEASRKAYARKPDDLAVIWSLERGLFRNGCWNELGVLREKEAQLELDPTVRVGKLMGAAVAYLQAQNAEEATRVSQECLNFDAHCLTALRVLARLAEERGDHAELAALCDRLAEACTDPKNRLECRLVAADLWSERVSDSSRALASLAVALSDQPDQPDAFARAERLLREGKRFEELSRLYRRRIKACRTPEERALLLHQHARLLREDLQDDLQAIAQLAELLALDPQNVSALAEQASLLIRQRHWSDAAAKLGLLVERTPDEGERHFARLEQAKLWLRHLHEPKRARDVLGAALTERPDDIETRKLLVELNTADGNWEEARRLLSELAAAEDPEVQAWAVVQLADVARLGLRDEGMRRQLEIDAIRTLAEKPRALSLLVEQCRKTREQQRFVENAERCLAEADLALSATVHLRGAVAKLLLEDLDQPDRALSHIEQALSMSSSDETVRILHAKALERRGERTSAVRELRAILQGNPASVEGYRGLARVMERAGQHETVVAALAVVDLLGEGSPEEAALLRGLEGAMTPAGRVVLESLPLLEDLRPLQRALELASPYFESVFPTQVPDPLPADHPTAAACSRLARAFGIGEVVVSLSGPVGAESGVGFPVPILLEPSLGHSPGDATFRFWVGRALSLAASSGAILGRLSDADLVDLADALCTTRNVSLAAQNLRKQFGKVLPRKLRKQLESMGLSTTESTWAAYRSADLTRADCLGLLAARNPRPALGELARLEGLTGPDALRSVRIACLAQFALSDEYARGVRGLWS